MPDYSKMRRLPFDPRMASEIRGSSMMSAEQGPQFLSEWGGPEGYAQVAQMPMEARVVFRALQDGVPATDIPTVTGLSTKETNVGTNWLVAKGVVSQAEMMPA